jgi:hypothetical protein
MAERRFRAHPRRVAPVLIGTTIAVLALGASPGLAATGGVYFDANTNAAAGNPAHLSTQPSPASTTSGWARP